MERGDAFNVQFRRIGLPATCRGVPDVFRITKKRTLIGRNKDEVDFFLFSSVHKKLISRVHAELIVQCKQEVHSPTYHLIDRSTNGTYLNDVKVAGSACLKHGDKITFGHMKGIGVMPGTFSQQVNTEFLFRFEECEDTRRCRNLPSTPPREVNSILSMTWNSNSISPLSMIRKTARASVSSIEKENTLHCTDVTDGVELSKTKDRETPIVNGFGRIELKPRQLLPSESQIHATQSCTTQTGLLASITQLKTPGKDSGVFDNDIFDSDHDDDQELLKLAERIGVDFTGFDSEEDIFSSNGQVNPSAKLYPLIPCSGKQGGTSPVLQTPACTVTSSKKHRRKQIFPPSCRTTSPALSPVTKNTRSVSLSPVIKKKRGRPPSKARRQSAPYQKKKSPAVKQKSSKAEREWDKCDFYACQRPQDDTVAWVQCDDCDGWYHVNCMGCTYDAVSDSKTAFHCGCM